MTARARHVLETFDSLPNSDKQEVAAEILRRLSGPIDGDLPESVLLNATDELFRTLDLEEKSNAPR